LKACGLFTGAAAKRNPDFGWKLPVKRAAGVESRELVSLSQIYSAFRSYRITQ
jgi:hypothetical protein